MRTADGGDDGDDGMKVAVYGDIHGDVEALRRARAQAERLGCRAHLCCGDFVDEGQPAAEIIALLRKTGTPCVRGNHERWLLAALHEGRYRHPLPPAAVGFLAALSPSLTLEPGRLAGARVAVHHARPGSDMDGLYPGPVLGAPGSVPGDTGNDAGFPGPAPRFPGPAPGFPGLAPGFPGHVPGGDLTMAAVRRLLAAAGCDVLLVGHTHQAFAVHHPGGGLVANPGALGRPPFVSVHRVPIIGQPGRSPGGEGSPGAAGTFGILVLPQRRFVVLDLDANPVAGDLPDDAWDLPDGGEEALRDPPVHPPDDSADDSADDPADDPADDSPDDLPEEAPR